ncbi:Hsp22 [Drosophila busckii]|uniref:Hsp22 n=1 Tax=Drosophila busckii TaxID=30019 RepID=A0A0M4EJA5_DROBS|nr:heat shock protein 22 [Drosophila busckii]ALC44990.1 Hsp22 [Drosophila busckii]
MRNLPMLLRMAEEMTRMPRLSPFQSFFREPPFWNSIAATPRNWQQIGRWQQQQLTPAASIGKEGYQVCLDVSDYKPNELTVKTINNNVVIEGKSEQQEDPEGGFSSRHFLRRFALPAGYEADKATSSLSSDGVLTINVPNPPAVQEALTERVVPIQQTGPAEVNVKPNPPLDEPDKKQEQQ